MSIFKTLILATLAVTITAFSSVAVSQTSPESEPSKAVRPISGKLILAGEGEITNRSLKTFAWLAGESDGRVVVVSNNQNIQLKDRLAQLVGQVLVLPPQNSNDPIQMVKAMQRATAVWLADDFPKSPVDERFQRLLQAVLDRDGVVAGQGVGAERLATSVGGESGIEKGFGLLPNSIVAATSGNQTQALRAALKIEPERVGWEIPQDAFVVVHEGRRIAVLGSTEISLRVAARGDWPERHESFAPPIDNLPYTTDLMAWSRSGQARTKPLFPPKVAPTPSVDKGTLIIIGGGGSTPDMWDCLIESAGGKSAKFVCISQSADSYGAKKLKTLGCQNVQVFFSFSKDKTVPGDDGKLLTALKDADAIYLGGGRTFRFMDAYQNTQAHQLMRSVLAKGGVIAGTSAGAQIQGDFLVRGDPRTNQTLWYKGNDTGLGFLQGVIIDAHFRQRGRHNTFPELLKLHPQMLGIGIDEATAIVVTGTEARVLGRHNVTFYNNAANGDAHGPVEPVVLSAKEIFDFKNRKQILPNQ